MPETDATLRAYGSYTEGSRANRDTEILEEASRMDAAEDELHGEARGDELPQHLARREGRRAWLREAKQRLDRERDEQAEPIPRARAERLELCRRRLVEDWQTERQGNRDYEAYRERGVRERGKHAMGSRPNRSSCPNNRAARSTPPIPTRAG